jgi:prophage regulatory protein
MSVSQSPRPRRALRLPQVLAKVGMRKTQLFDAVKAGVFPKPFNVLPGGRAIAWDESEIDEHLERQMAARVKPVEPPRLAVPAQFHPKQKQKALA